MPHISKRKLDVRVERELETLFEYVLGHLNPNEAQKLLESLLSKTEKLMLAKRIAAVFLLHENLTEFQISETIKLTPDTLSKLAMLLETPRGQGFRVAIAKAQNLQRIRLFKKILLEVAGRVIRGAGGRL